MSTPSNLTVLDYLGRLRSHYRSVWGGAEPEKLRLTAGPIDDLPAGFSILRFGPHMRRCWTYATCGMSQASDEARLEVHLFSAEADQGLVELLTAVAHYHRTGARLGLGHTVNFGRPWIAGSACTHGLLSLPYLDGPKLELFELPIGLVRFLWLIPVTPREVQYATEKGLEALETRFEEERFNYLNPMRESVV